MSDDQPAGEGIQEPYFLMCSGCYTPTVSTEAHVIPFWNKTVSSILTTYRCNNCWLPALAETREAVQSGNDEVLSSFCDFLKLQGFTSDSEKLRTDPPEQTKAVLLAILDATGDGRAVFHP